MTNIDSLRQLCNAIANTFYPDDATLEFALFNEGITPDAAATPKDPQIFRVAVGMVRGYVESSRSENGISTSVMSESVEKSLMYWCNVYGVDADEILADSSLRGIDDASNLY
nr:MAG TPA: hypothetical protein [Caudoviricetes sp.]